MFRNISVNRLYVHVSKWVWCSIYIDWLIGVPYKHVGFIARKTLNYLNFQSFDFERTWWRLFQKLIVCIKLDIYDFNTCMQKSKLSYWIMVINDNQESREDLVGNQIFETANKSINYGFLKNSGSWIFFQHYWMGQ